MKIGNSEKPVEILEFIVTQIESLRKDLEGVFKKSVKECSKGTQCCLVAPLLKSVLEKLDWCIEKLKQLIELVSKGGCEKCLYYSKTTGLCLKTRKKTYGIPLCGGAYFRESLGGTSRQ
ncbi:hypothetical protein EYM_01090 [Ignicoccus islandicus DSM 13165]|uniref:Uncharacterized protein n=1 Tax=Ignicoccus islandicus DSM 13165 TaxID=940295 RepID=A0A0U2WMJ4_9CREN|nr:hypothetical protein [Ignicoccus islandicus]ALU12177.1 hypothetical protein EYM_01090 [Ignicoccus islandicus DSM 13165]